MSEFTPKPTLLKRIGVWFLFSIIGLSLFGIIYNISVDTSPKPLLEAVIEKTHDYASESSISSLITGVNTTCEALDKQLDTFGIDLNQDPADIHRQATQIGLQDDDLEYLTGLYSLCKKTNLDSEKFVQSIGDEYVLSKLNITDDTEFVDIIDDNYESLPVQSAQAVEKMLPLAKLFSSVGKLVALMILCLMISFILCIKFMEYFLSKIATTIAGVGLGFVIPFFLLQIYLSKNPIDTSFLFTSISKALSNNLSFNLSNILAKLQTAFLSILLEILFPFNLFILGVILLLLGIGLFVLIKILGNKGVFNSDV